MKYTLLPLLATGLLSLVSCDQSSESTGSEAKVTTLRFSAIPDEDSTGQTARFKPVADYLAKKLDMKVEFVPSDSYGASVEKFQTGDIQLAWFGGVSGVQARQAVEGAKAIASGDKDLEFKSYFIANSSTGMTESSDFPEGIKDLTFTFGSAGSTSGCIMPSNYILEETGKGPMEFFTKKPLGFSGAHDATAKQVAAGTFQAGALNYSTYEKMVKNGDIDPAVCVKIWETPTYADYNFTAHPALGEEVIEKLQDALINCDDEATLKALDRDKLVKVDNDTFAGIATVLEKVSFE